MIATDAPHVQPQAAEPGDEEEDEDESIDQQRKKKSKLKKQFE